MEYLTDVIILLTAAVIAVPLCQSAGLGAIPGFLIAGVVLGPSGLSYIDNYNEIAHLSELGVVLLLFIIGVEINPTRLWRMKSLVLGLGSLQVLITGGLITVVAHQFISAPWEISLLIGMSLALSSTAFVLQLLTQRKVLSSEYGKATVAVLLLQDLSVVPLLALVSLMASSELTMATDVFLALAEAVAILLLIVLITRYVLNPLLNWLARLGSPEIFTALALLLVLGSAQALERVGLSMAMGAFVAGLLIADSSYRHQIIAEIQPFRGLLLGLFFMSMGMSLNLAVFLDNPLVFLVITIGLMSVKFLVLWPLSRLFGIPSKVALSQAGVLAQSGEFALVIFALANGLGLIEPMLFQQLLVVVMLSMLATPVLEYLAYQNYSVSRHQAASTFDVVTGAPELSTRPVILAGFGRMGQRVGSILDLMEVPYLAIDNNEVVVNRERGGSRSVYFGDAQQPEVLRAAGVADTPLMVVSIDDSEVTAKVVATVCSVFPETPVFARGHDLAGCRKLRALGASFTVSETFEASAELARATLLHLGEDSAEVEAVLEDFRKKYYRLINEDSSSEESVDS